MISLSFFYFFFTTFISLKIYSSFLHRKDLFSIDYTLSPNSNTMSYSNAGSAISSLTSSPLLGARKDSFIGMSSLSLVSTRSDSSSILYAPGQSSFVDLAAALGTFSSGETFLRGPSSHKKVVLHAPGQGFLTAVDDSLPTFSSSSLILRGPN